MKPIKYDAFFKRKELSAEPTESIGYITVTNKKDNNSTATSTSVKVKYYGASETIAVVNEPGENKSNYDVISIDLASSSFKKDIELVDKDNGKT